MASELAREIIRQSRLADRPCRLAILIKHGTNVPPVLLITAPVVKGKQLLQIKFDDIEYIQHQIQYDAEHNLEGAAQFLVMFIKNTPTSVPECRAELHYLEEGNFGTSLGLMRWTPNRHNREVLFQDMQSILRALLTV